MGTKEFNWLDKFIARLRLGKVLPYIHENDRILDFGCGHQAYLLHHIPNIVSHAVGVDYDTEDEKIAPHVETIKFKFKSALPFRERSLDRVFLLAVLEHLAPPLAERLFWEFRRVLKPEGKIILTTPTPRGKVLLDFLAFRLGVISKEEVGDHKKYYGKSDITTLAKHNGLKISRYETFWLGMNSFAVLEKA